MNNGVIKCSEAAKYFRDAKIGNAKAKNVISHIWHLLDKDDAYEKIEPGTFRLRETTKE